MTAPRPTHFDEPWQAELFALTIALNEAGHFTWPDWTRAFGATLTRHGAARVLDGGADYHAAWIETLEALLDARGFVGRDEAETVRAAWKEAYLSTPHGVPVQLVSDA